jgi:hypothetical protein
MENSEEESNLKNRSFKSVAFPCGEQWQPVFMAYDSAKLVGLSGNAKGIFL